VPHLQKVLVTRYHLMMKWIQTPNSQRALVVENGLCSLAVAEGIPREDLTALRNELRKDTQAYVPIEGMPVPDLTTSRQVG
jgi:hypothetical protein